MDPFTIAAGIAAAGQLFKGITSLLGGNAEDKIAKQNAGQAEGEAGVNAQTELQQGDAVAARAATQAAANGGGFVGSSLGIISQLSSQAMFRARAATYRGLTQANADIYQGSVAKAQGVDGLVSGIISAGSSLLGGMAQSSLFGQQSAALSQLRGAGADSVMDYAPAAFT